MTTREEVLAKIKAAGKKGLKLNTLTSEELSAIYPLYPTVLTNGLDNCVRFR